MSVWLLEGLMHRRSHGLVLAATLSAGLALWPQAATAQWRVENGIVIRPDLKGNPPAGGSSDLKGLVTAGRFPATEKLCDSNKPCVTMVLVLRGGVDATDPKKPKWDSDGCSVYWPYDAIRVQRGLQPVLTWMLVKDPGDDRTYAFIPNYGIRVTGNDPTRDLYKPTLDASGMVFTWNNLHFQASKLEFVPNVWRIENGRRTKACNAGDPYVYNDN